MEQKPRGRNPQRRKWVSNDRKPKRIPKTDRSLE